MKEITIQIPDNKTIEWIDGTMRLVDEKLPVTERIKTFDDAYKELGENHPLTIRYNCVLRMFKRDPMAKDLIAYLKLCIIVAALNEGWEPEKGEECCYPCFYSQTNGVRFIYAGYDSARSSSHGARLTFKTLELATYAGKQFTEEFLQFYNRI